MTVPSRQFRLRDILLLGGGAYLVYRWLRAGKVERIARGVYRPSHLEPTELETISIVAARYPHAIVCLLSALHYHQIGTQLPRQLWIAIGIHDRTPTVDDIPLRVFRYSGINQTEGVVEHLADGVPFRVTTPARTIVDCFRYRNKVGLDVAVEALRDAVRSRKVAIGDVARVARACGAGTVVEPYLYAFGS